jgi:hypothetical protein
MIGDDCWGLSLLRNLLDVKAIEMGCILIAVY